MALYQYACDDDGPFDATAPIGTAPALLPCPACRNPSRRVFTAPRLSRASGPAFAAIERAERSASAPDVVTSLPPSARRTPRPGPAASPALRKLPRP